MTLRTLEAPGPIEGVLFDFHSTLVDQGEPAAWLDLAWARARRAGTPPQVLGPERFAALVGWLGRIWEHAAAVDPDSARDLSAERHRAVYDAVITRAPAVPADLADALYQVLLEPWVPYDDALPTLRELKRRGIKVALVSNIGLDVRSALARMGLAPLIDAVVLSCEAGAVKPHAVIFERALAALGVGPARALMVGDNPRDDAGAALIGVRTLLLPRTHGPTHGLEAVLRLIGL
jgi:HAD superfamily hydrolase (TIGR01509 family)